MSNGGNPDRDDLRIPTTSTRQNDPPAPLVSIILTSYNYEKFLREAIDSALQQTYDRVEVIVVDDGSTDSSPDIIRSYGNRVTAVFRANGGQAAAEYSGFLASSGEIVIVLDSDDCLYRDAVATVAAAWRKDVAKVQFYLDAVDGEGNPLGFRLPKAPMIHGDMRPLVERYGYYPSPPTSGNAYSRALLQRLMPLDEAMWRQGPDGPLNALSALYGEVVSLDQSFGCYRIHGKNMFAGAISLAALRSNFRNELDREDMIRAHLASQGRSLKERLCLNIPSHIRARIVSLRLDPEHHPVPTDRLASLTLAGIRSAWKFPHLRLARRMLESMSFPMIALLPRSVLVKLMELLFRGRAERVFARKKARQLRLVERRSHGLT